MIHLNTMLTELKLHYGLVSLKAGTEWEDMNYSEIAHLNALSNKQLPTLVKIAGPEAKTDLRHMREIGINGILGPMIESVYSLEKFVITSKQVYEGSQIRPMLAINVETIQGYQQLDLMMDSPFFNEIDLVVIGRLDLSLSMKIEDVDHPEVVKITQDLASRISRRGKHVSIGGFVNPGTAVALQNMDVDRLSTIHTMFDLNKVKDATTSIQKAIEFEIAYYESLIPINPHRKAFYQSRITTSQAKLDVAAELFKEDEQRVAA